MRALRCSLVVLAATGVAAVAMLLLAPSVGTAGGDGFEGALVRGCAAIGCGCAGWGWLGVVAVAAEALRGPRTTVPRVMPGVPAVLRRLVLAGCGVALTATAGPALAGSGADTQHGMPQVLAGLPFPSRATDVLALDESVVVVRPGDSLWAITERRLAPGASDADITSGWQALYARNREVVGSDPSLIHPGQHLALPDHLEEPS
jgi:nucleoid-associated protein YgaU